MTDDHWNIFLSLLRAGLWEQDLRLDEPLAAGEWGVLRKEALDQSVLGILLRGVTHLPADQLPPTGEQAIQQSWANALANVSDRISRVEEELIPRLMELGVHPTIQKGSTVARYYALPEMRQGGDIDVYCPEFELARAIAPRARTAPDGSVVFVHDGVTIELHHRFYDLHIDPELLPEPGSSYSELLLLSSHILKHAIGAGVGFKQLCDMARALDALNGEYDKPDLEMYLRRAGIFRWHRMLCSLLVESLGLNPRCCLDGFRPCNAEPLRRIVRSGGHFGQASAFRRRSMESSAAARKIVTAGAFVRRLPFSLYYAPRETFATVRELVRGNLK